MAKSRDKKNEIVKGQLGEGPDARASQDKAKYPQDPMIIAKQSELKEAQMRLLYYKKEIGNMRRHLEDTYNIQKITQLEDEQKNKKRILQQLQDENKALCKVQKDQEQALKSLSKENEYEKKIHELDGELKLAKEHLRKVNTKKREDERAMKHQHDQLIALEDKCRKMAIVIKEKKKQRQEIKQKDTKEVADQNIEDQKEGRDKQYSMQDLKQLEQELKLAEQEKNLEERKLKEQAKQQEVHIRSL